MFSSAMAKKSYKQHHKHEKVQVGCMSGLIRMLDFRRHPKLLSDGRVKRDPKVSEDIHGSITADNDKDCRAELIYAGRASIKTLMDEEMASSTQPLMQGQRTGICSDDIDLNLAASLMEIYRNHNQDQEISNSAESDFMSDSTGDESNSPSTNLNQIRSNIQKALEDVAEAVIRHQSANTKYIPSSGEARSKEFVDALHLLSSNKELFLMLMQDPSSRLLECLKKLYMSLGSTKLECEAYDEETELQGTAYSPDQSVASPRMMQRRHNSFLMEDKLVMRKPPKLNNNSRGLSRIVILRPSPARSHTSLISSSATSSPLSNHTNFHVQEDGDKSDHHFSLKDLKRRLRLAVSNNRKDNQLNSMSGTFHTAEVDSGKQFPDTSMSVASTDTSECKVAEEPSVVDKETVTEDSGSGTRNDATHGVGSFSYEKAKMYLIERLNSQGEDSSHIVQKSESFERLISLPENGIFSQSDCPQEKVGLADESTDASDLQTVEQDDSLASPNPAMVYPDTVPAHTDNFGNQMSVELKIEHRDHPLSESTNSHELNNEGVKIMQDITENPPPCAETETLQERVAEESHDQFSSEEPKSMNVLPEVALHSPHDPFNEQENHSPSEVIQSVKPSVLTCPCSPENTNEREEKLSPQSVLDSVVGDITSPIHKTRKQDEFSMPVSRGLFKELDTKAASPVLWNGPQVTRSILDEKDARFCFIKTVLNTSGLLSDEISQRWYTEESPLDISVLAEVGNLYCLTDEAVLLFDCVEEVLLKIRDKFFNVDPWVSFLKHNVRPAPVGRNLLHEVTKCIDTLVINEFPNTLDQVIMKDLEVESWMDLRHDAGGVAIELWDGLFDDLLEEMVFDLWL
ncbi:hypothetical protein EJB05_38415 [Eragrostis curvula]|uniref:DUF4378 domain-containing protein n=1 Tax=Eragrostis curvula TaxID=38414 RepID=A0A5J9TVT7_9POAL|nr:hypothetical protein EJB05_38415 [Eragrostis curvula]